MKIKILISILMCIGLMLCFIACSGVDTGAGGNNPTESSAPSQNGGGESKPSDSTDESVPSDNTDESVPSDSTDESKPSEDVDKKVYHTVTFITNSDSVIEPVQVEHCEKIAQPQTIEKAGYIFDGWHLGNEKWSFSNCVVTEDITLTAEWIANENTLVFDGNGATGGEMENMTIKSDEAVALSKGGFVKVGYTFMGWATTQGGEVEYADGAEYVMGTDSSYTLYAVWQANENTLVFNANGGEGAMENMAIGTDSTVGLTINKFTKDGYTFVGWSTTPNGEIEYADGAEYTMGADGEYTLYAVWQVNVNRLSFNANGGLLTINNLLLKTGETATLPQYLYKRNGYIFMGWSTTKDGEVEYLDGDEYTMGPESFYTLYAVWKLEIYTITYEKNGGTGEVTESFTINDLPLTLNDLNNKENFLFNGWYLKSDLSGVPVLKITELDNVTLYAGYIEGTDGLIIADNFSRVTVTGYNGSATDVIIPKSYKGKPVEIGSSAFKNCTSLTSITIPDGVTSIGNYAFEYCTSLASITIGDGVKSIGGSAFKNCTSLTSITIPNSVTRIDSSAFSGCTNLASVTIGDGVTSIGNSAFENCESLTSITIPDSVTSIGVSAFRDCYSLTGITIPDSVTSIGDSAFRGCTSMTNVTIENGVTSIGDSAFRDCYSLTGITIPDSVTSIGKYAFDNCRSLTNVTIGNSVTSIGDSAFRGCSGLTSITIPNGVTSIGNSTFSNCTSLTNVTIGNSVTSIGDSAFWGCSGLTSITIPNGVTSIGKSAFCNCRSLTNVTIGNSVTSIGDFAFLDCYSMTSITIPDSVTSIGKSAFENCKKLTSITIPNSVTSIGDNAFNKCESLTIYCEAEKHPDGWSSSWNVSNCPVEWGKAINQ